MPTVHVGDIKSLAGHFDIGEMRSGKVRIREKGFKTSPILQLCHSGPNEPKCSMPFGAKRFVKNGVESKGRMDCSIKLEDGKMLDCWRAVDTFFLAYAKKNWLKWFPKYHVTTVARLHLEIEMKYKPLVNESTEFDPTLKLKASEVETYVYKIMRHRELAKAELTDVKAFSTAMILAEMKNFWFFGGNWGVSLCAVEIALEPDSNKRVREDVPAFIWDDAQPRKLVKRAPASPPAIPFDPDYVPSLFGDRPASPVY